MFFERFKLRYVYPKYFLLIKKEIMKKSQIMKILCGYQKQTRAGDGKLKPQFPRPKPYAEDAPVVVKHHAKVTSDAKLYLPPS